MSMGIATGNDDGAVDRTRRLHDAGEILRAAIAAADPAPLVRRALDGAVELADERPVHIVAVGKAAPRMFEPAFELLHRRVASQLIVAPHGTACDRPALFGAHPVPDATSLRAGHAVLDVLTAARDGELVLMLLSGGASSVIALPLADITVEEYADCARRLMLAGADIAEINTFRKQVDALKGGRMAALAAPAAVLGLVLSDVVGDSLDIIASGPLTPDHSSAADALHVLRRHDLLDDCATSIRRLLEHHAATDATARDETFDSVRVRLVGGNDVAMNGAAARAAELGYEVRRAPDPVTGPAGEAGYTLAREARLLQRSETLPVCIVAGGETTVAVGGDGLGGRNQHIVLAACVELDCAAGITVGSIGTDGIDGPTDAAGAVADEATLDVLRRQGVDAVAALADFDSHTALHAADGLIVTGPTGTNVNDVQIAIVAAPVS